MNYKRACEILESVDETVKDCKKLQKQYYSMALKYHPDKYKDDDGEKFKEIQEAYEYLKKYNNIDVGDETSDYMSILERFIKLFSPNTQWNSVFMDTTFKGIIKDYENISLNIFDNISKDKSIEVYLFIKKYQTMFHISDKLLENMREIIQKKMKNDNLIILNPSIDDILKDNMYKLEISEKTFYVPLWFNELEFRVSDTQDVIVKCNCELPSNMDIDKNNNIIYHYCGKIRDIIREKSILIKMGEKELMIPVRELHIRTNQVYVLKRKGMLRSNNNDIYDTTNRGDVIVHINLV